MCTRVGFRSKLKAQISSRNMHKYKKNMFEQENTKTFLYFPFLPGWIFKNFFPIFENLSSAGSKNRKLNCSGLNKIIDILVFESFFYNVFWKRYTF